MHQIVKNKWLQVLCDYSGAIDFRVNGNIVSFSFGRKYEEYSAPSAEEFCNITAGTYAKAEVLVSLAVWEIARFICKEAKSPWTPQLTSPDSIGSGNGATSA
jgi:hypothetical protein